MQSYIKFYDSVEKIVLYDPLADFLGSLKGGVAEIDYTEVVKFAGHSCPTVAGAYVCTQKGLKALYGDDLPVRGEVFVSFKEQVEDGVCGVVSNVISNITGATDKSGFKGLNGMYARDSLMSFGKKIDSSVRFKRLDTGEWADVYYNPSAVGQDPQLKPLMQQILQKKATDEQKRKFAKLWQKRVERILLHSDEHEGLIRVQKAI